MSSKQFFESIITYLGILITFWGEIDTSGNQIVFGTFLVFMSALTDGSYLFGSGLLIPEFGIIIIIIFTSYAMIVSIVCVCIHYILVDRTAVFCYSYEVYILEFLKAIVPTLIPFFFVSLAIKKMNASNFRS